MSRIGRRPVPIPQGVSVQVVDSQVVVEGPKGRLTQPLLPEVRVEVEDGQAVVTRVGDEKRHRALHGLTRSLLANMVQGVTQGFKKSLELKGVGYRAQKQGNKLVLAVGYSRPVELTPPPGIEVEVPAPTKITVRGIDKQLVGQVAADIRAVRPPEPYLGKGISYEGERIRRKAGKAGKGKGR